MKFKKIIVLMNLLLHKKSDNSNKPSLGENVAKIKVFQQRTGQLETTLLSNEYINYYFRESNFSYLNKIDSKKFNVIFNEKDFDEKQKKYFDKRIFSSLLSNFRIRWESVLSKILIGGKSLLK